MVERDGGDAQLGDQLVRTEIALRRLAMLVARGSESEVIFAAFTAEIGRVLAVPFTGVVRYDETRGKGIVVGAWSEAERPSPILVGDIMALGSRDIASLVFE